MDSSFDNVSNCIYNVIHNEANAVGKDKVNGFFFNPPPPPPETTTKCYILLFMIFIVSNVLLLKDLP